MLINRAYRYRIYPNEIQKQQLSRTFGCSRFVYNKCLEEVEKRYKLGEPFPSKFDLNSFCNHVLKDNFPFLREADKFAITNTVYYLHGGYVRFFKNLGEHPKFKSKKHSEFCYSTNYTNGNISVAEKSIKLPKVGNIRANVHREPPCDGKIKSATVTMERDGTYYVSVLYAIERRETPEASVEHAVGLDYKSDGLYMNSESEWCDMPHYYRTSSRKLAREQRKLKNKKEGSSNWKKQQKKVAKVHRHVANQRKDYLHKASTEIVNQYDTVCVEDLDMRAMSNKGFGNGKATLDNGYGMFLAMLSYKLADQGKHLVKVDKWYPSSQLCHVCGNRKKLALQERIYRCDCCGGIFDRDVNAAINIKEKGLQMLLMNAA